MLENQKYLFNLSEDITYLNCAYMSPLMKRVENAGKTGMELKRQPNGVLVHDFFKPTEKLRSEFSKLIHCSDPKQVVVIPSVSYGIASIAGNLQISRGSNIIIAGEQFPSNVYCWYQTAKSSGANVQVIDPPIENHDRGKRWNEKIIESINSRTALVAISHCHWADGTRFDLKT